MAGNQAPMVEAAARAEYWCVLTLDGRSIDRMVLPFLARLGVRGVMLSMHYARGVRREALAGLALFLDSGGFGLIARGGQIERAGETWDLVSPADGEGEPHRLTAAAVLARQQEIADIGATLDAPIPPGTPRAEAHRRMEMTLANAAWAAAAPRPSGFRLYGAVQGEGVADYRACARALDALALDGLAIGGLVPRLGAREEVLAIAEAVRSATDKPLHAFGVGQRELVGELARRGIGSVDSSSPLRAAASGISWRGWRLTDPTPFERLRAALENIAALTGASVPEAGAG